MSAPTLKHLQMKDVNGVAVINFMESGLMFEAILRHGSSGGDSSG